MEERHVQVQMFGQWARFYAIVVLICAERREGYAVSITDLDAVGIPWGKAGTFRFRSAGKLEANRFSRFDDVIIMYATADRHRVETAVNLRRFLLIKRHPAEELRECNGRCVRAQDKTQDKYSMAFMWTQLEQRAAV